MFRLFFISSKGRACIRFLFVVRIAVDFEKYDAIDT